MTTTAEAKVRTVRKSPIVIETAMKTPEGTIVWTTAASPLNEAYVSTAKAISALREAAIKGTYRVVAIKRPSVKVETETITNTKVKVT